MCSMQDAGSRIVPKMDSSAWCRMQDAECRMQNQTQRVCPLGATHSFEPGFCILHPHPASCIGCKASGFGPDSAFCILHLHPASGAVHSFGADSAFCILHSASASCMLSCWCPGTKDSYSRAQITHDHLLRSANGATRPGGRTQQPPAGPREQRVSSGELS